jgi:hypothetical protein
MIYNRKTTVKGSSANTGPAVIRLGSGRPDTSLQLPLEIDLTTREGLRQLNERFDQIEKALRHTDESEVSLAVKFGYGALAAAGASATPVPGAKVVLDKPGTWLILATFDWTAASGSEGFVVVDPETTDGAKKQDALCRVTGTITTTAWCLFTAVKIPRLAQLYMKGAGALEEAGTSICAIWLSHWAPGSKRFGRNVESVFTGATDLNGDPLTDHGEEARYPLGDHPDVIANGVELDL